MRPPFFMVFHKSVIYIELALASAPAIFLRTVLVFFARCVAMYCHSFLQGTLQSLF